MHNDERARFHKVTGERPYVLQTAVPCNQPTPPDRIAPTHWVDVEEFDSIADATAAGESMIANGATVYDLRIIDVETYRAAVTYFDVER